MASSPTVAIRGLDEARLALRSVEAGVEKGLRLPGLAAARVVAGEARHRAPERSGRLKATIRPSATQRGAAVRAGNVKVPYAGVTEFGGTIPKRGNKGHRTARRGTARRATEEVMGLRTTIPRQSFIYPAIVAKSDEVTVIYLNGVHALLRQHGF